MSAVITLPVKTMQGRSALRQARAFYPNGLGGVFVLPNEKWLIATQFSLSQQFLSWWKGTNLKNSGYLEVYGGQVLWVVIRETKLQVAYLGTMEHADILLEFCCDPKLTTLQVFTNISSEHPLSRKLQTLEQRALVEKLPVPEGLKSTVKYKSLARLQHGKPALALISASVFIALFLQVKQEPENIVAPTLSDEQEVALQLEAQPGKVTPLLRLDYNNQTVFEQMPGWSLKRAHYTPQEVQYELERTDGSLRQLRQVSHQTKMHLANRKDHWVASQAIQLPAPVHSVDALDWVSVEALSDWLDYQLRLWLPDARLLAVPSAKKGIYQQTQMVILFEKLHLPDLLTLAAILDGLPIQLKQGEVERRKEQVSGHIELVAYGVEHYE